MNRSRGPGGLTRCAPVGLFLSPQRMERSEIGLLGAESAALTHGDPLGFLPAAYLVEIINRIVYDPVKSFREVLRETRASMRGQFGSQFRQLCALEECLTQAESMAAEDTPPALCLERLMPVEAPEVLAAACYVCLKYPGDFDRAILAAVNHSGHSAAVGCVAGAHPGRDPGNGWHSGILFRVIGAAGGFGGAGCRFVYRLPADPRRSAVR